MAPQHELGVILRALEIGLFSPHQLDEIRAEWAGQPDSTFLEFLLRRGELTPRQLHELETLSQKSSLQAPTLDPHRTRPDRPPGEAPTLKGDGGDRPGPTGTADPVPPRLDGARYRDCAPHELGGLGQIWKVYDVALGRVVALKTLRADRAVGATVRARFAREARITGQLEHPGVVPLYDLIADTGPAAGDFCYTMRFIEGETLAAAVAAYHARRVRNEAGPLELARLLDAFGAVCRTVAFAHARDILHRDLKGPNVILGKYGEVFVLDWGLGKHVDEAPDAADAADTPTIDFQPVPGPTKAGAIVGTPAFMSPQVAAGAPGTKSSDIYGLGAVLYSILTGSPPYSGPTPEAIVAKVVAKPPLAPSLWTPAVSPALEAICRKAMAREPADRYGSAAELADEVRRWQADEPVAAYRDRAATRALRWAKLHRAPVFAGAAFLVTALVASSAAAVLVWNEKERTELQRRAAVRNYDRARAQSFAAIELMEKHEGDFAANAELLAGRKRVLIETAKAFRTFLEQTPDDAELVSKSAVVFRYAANVHRFENEHELARPLYADAIATLRTLIEGEPEEPAHRVRLCETLRDRSQSDAVLGKLREAEDLLRESLEIAEALLEGGPGSAHYRRLVALVQLDSCGLYACRGQLEELERTSRSAAEAFGALMKSPGQGGGHPYDTLFYAGAMNWLAQARCAPKQREEAIAMLKATSKLIEGFNRGSHAGVANADVVQMQARTLQQRAEILMSDPKRRTEAANLLTFAIGLWKDLAKSSANNSRYMHQLATANRMRGLVSLQSGNAKSANDDFLSALSIVEGLDRKSPGLPGFLEETGRICHALAALKGAQKGGEAEAGKLSARAQNALRSARKISPDDDAVRRILSDLENTARGLGKP